MSLTPLAIRKTRFATKLRGYDPAEVEEFLDLVSEELTGALTAVERLEQERDASATRLAATEERERRLQETLLRAQRVSDEILANAQREAQVLVKEAEITADRIVQQAIDQAQEIERKIAELAFRRRELQARCKSAVELFSELLASDVEDGVEPAAAIRSLPRHRAGGRGQEPSVAPTRRAEPSEG